MKARIHVTLKHGVLDPQGRAIYQALHTLGYQGVRDVRQGKYIEIDIEERDKIKARESVDGMCRDLLANGVIENYAIELAD